MRKWTCPFFPRLLTMNSRFYHLFIELLFLFNKQLQMCSLHMSNDGSYTINFVVFNYTLSENRSLSQNIIRCLFRSTTYALQHLWFHKIHRKAIIDNKRSPTYKHTTVKFPSHNLCFYNIKLWNINIWHVRSWHISTFENDENDIWTREDDIWKRAIDGVSSLIPSILSTK